MSSCTDTRHHPYFRRGELHTGSNRISGRDTPVGDVADDPGTVAAGFEAAPTAYPRCCLILLSGVPGQPQPAVPVAPRPGRPGHQYLGAGSLLDRPYRQVVDDPRPPSNGNPHQPGGPDVCRCGREG